METLFTPWSALFGGSLIGLAAVLLMLSIGRIAGISGIVGGALLPDGADQRAWRLAFLIGMVAAAPLAMGMGVPVTIQIPVGWVALVIGGLLVGIGVTLGNGCTSGHGVCGLSRASGRSLVATLTFMATAMFTVFVTRHLLGG